MTSSLHTRGPDWSHPALEAYAGASLLLRDADLSDAADLCRGRLCYLATPYSKIACYDDGEFDPSASLDCAVRAARWSRRLALEGVTAVSPIIQAVEMVHADFIDQQLDPLDGAFWEQWCRPLLHACEVILVPPIPGWQESDGIWQEVCHAFRFQKRVVLIAPDGAGAT